MVSSVPYVFPHRIKHQFVTYRLVLLRRIPERLPAAVYCSHPTFSQGQLVIDYLVLGPDQLELARADQLDDALRALFLRQDVLRPLSRKQRRLASRQPASVPIP